MGQLGKAFRRSSSPASCSHGKEDCCKHFDDVAHVHVCGTDWV